MPGHPPEGRNRRLLAAAFWRLMPCSLPSRNAVFSPDRWFPSAVAGRIALDRLGGDAAQARFAMPFPQASRALLRRALRSLT